MKVYDKLEKGDNVQLPPLLSQLSKEELIESYILAEDNAQSLISYL